MNKIKIKKIIMSVLALTLSLGIFVGCGNKAAQTTNNSEQKTVTDSSKEVKFVEEDGLLTYTDTKNSPFENSGLKILIKKGEDGYVKFIKTDLKGAETLEYYNFDYAKNTAEKYYYVSAMGTGFHYYYDLEKSELVKIEDQDHNDSTQKTKDSKRWNKAAEKIDNEVKALEKYYEEQYGINIKDAI